MYRVSILRFIKKLTHSSLKVEFIINKFTDEEIGGVMHIFVKSKEFKNLNVGFEMDEGVASTTDEYLLYYAERSIWRKYY